MQKQKKTANDKMEKKDSKLITKASDHKKTALAR
jgi:hypothetical protein